MPPHATHPPVLPQVLIPPGFVCVPREGARLMAVIAAGVALTVYDRFRRMGGMGHYLHPRRRRGQSSALYAAPAIVTLIEAFLSTGSRPGDLETAIYGGAENPGAPGYEPGRGRANVAAACEVMRKLGISPGSMDTAGRRARKIIFHTATGESWIARVSRSRAGDWYPPLPS